MSVEVAATRKDVTDARGVVVVVVVGVRWVCDGLDAVAGVGSSRRS